LAAFGDGRIIAMMTSALAPTLRWPPAPDEPPLVTIESAALIRRPIAAVFNFATNASLWTSWHPATAAVTATPRRPLAAGETVTETIRAGGYRFEATWHVLACEPPTRWVIATAARNGDARIVYELFADDAEGPTRFIRTLAYRSHRPWSLLDRTLTRRLLERQSDRAIDNLKSVLERNSAR
jgi:uncharacterized protein YndB with AHSA1/START domain